MRFVTQPLAEAPFVIQSGLPEFQLLWLSHLLPEGRRPTAASIQTLPSALLASLCEQPAFNAVGGTAFAGATLTMPIASMARCDVTK